MTYRRKFRNNYNLQKLVFMHELCANKSSTFLLLNKFLAIQEDHMIFGSKKKRKHLLHHLDISMDRN